MAIVITGSYLKCNKTFRSGWPFLIISCGANISNISQVWKQPISKFIVSNVSAQDISRHNDDQLNTLRPRRTGSHFADDIFKCILLNGNLRISIQIPIKFISYDPINNNPALVQIMAWSRSSDKPLCELMMVSLLMHISVTPVKLPSGECTKTSLMISQHWFK